MILEFLWAWFLLNGWNFFGQRWCLLLQFQNDRFFLDFTKDMWWIIDDYWWLNNDWSRHELFQYSRRSPLPDYGTNHRDLNNRYYKWLFTLLFWFGRINSFWFFRLFLWLLLQMLFLGHCIFLCLFWFRAWTIRGGLGWFGVLEYCFDLLMVLFKWFYLQSRWLFSLLRGQSFNRHVFWRLWNGHNFWRLLNRYLICFLRLNFISLCLKWHRFFWLFNFLDLVNFGWIRFFLLFNRFRWLWKILLYCSLCWLCLDILCCFFLRFLFKNLRSSLFLLFRLCLNWGF